MITLVTGNKEKQREIEAIMGIPLQIVSMNLPEIQSMKLEEVARAKAQTAFERVKAPVIVDDVSLEVDALNGFPGPLVKWWETVLGYEAMLQLAVGKSQAVKAVAMAVYADGLQTIVATGEMKGTLSPKAGDDGFGFDFYFIPEGYDKTIAQLGRGVKNQISHRAKCFQELAKKLEEEHIHSLL